ncbi:MAG: hypothetical protein NkDv07_0337 [Candidatus Improbicoccus devescovinae]|nr:MAG: hypothetical protein NkDv07_0337 [Candidatus Improbicoccus devescovinae]
MFKTYLTKMITYIIIFCLLIKPLSISFRVYASRPETPLGFTSLSTDVEFPPCPEPEHLKIRNPYKSDRIPQELFDVLTILGHRWTDHFWLTRDPHTPLCIAINYFRYLQKCLKRYCVKRLNNIELLEAYFQLVGVVFDTEAVHICIPRLAAWRHQNYNNIVRDLMVFGGALIRESVSPAVFNLGPDESCHKLFKQNIETIANAKQRQEEERRRDERHAIYELTKLRAIRELDEIKKSTNSRAVSHHVLEKQMNKLITLYKEINIKAPELVPWFRERTGVFPLNEPRDPNPGYPRNTRFFRFPSPRVGFNFPKLYACLGYTCGQYKFTQMFQSL